MNSSLKILFLFGLLGLMSCKNTVKEQDGLIRSAQSVVQYAHSFSLTKYDAYEVLTIHPSEDTATFLSYVLASEGAEIAKIHQGFQKIQRPIQRIAATTVTAYSFAHALHSSDLICGLADTSYLIDPEVCNAILAGKITEVSSAGNLQLESILSIDPQLFLASYIADDQLKRLESLGIVVMPFLDYSENHPLARAEYIKFLGALLDKDSLADSIFQNISTSYMSNKLKVASVQGQPTVFDGESYGGMWYVSGGQSYMAQFYKDAAADYVFSDFPSAISRPLDFESLFIAADTTQFWRIFVQEPINYKGLCLRDERIASFRAIEDKNVIYCNTVKSLYFSRGVLQPEEILADFIHIFHPDVMPERNNIYFYHLKEADF